MPKLLQDLIAAHASAQPEHCAIGWKEERIPYGELDRLTNQLAQTLRAHGCHPGDRVAVLIPNSPNALFAVLGILKAGCVAVPLDLSMPTRLLAEVLDDSRPSAVLAARAARPVLDDLFAVHFLGDQAFAAVSIGTLEALPIEGELFATAFSGLDVLRQPTDLPASRATANSPAFLFYGSGEIASGVDDASIAPVFAAVFAASAPRPTIVTHAEALAFLKSSQEAMPRSEFDRVASLPLVSPLAVAETFAAFASGAELQVIPPELLARPRQLAAFVRSHELTDWLTNHGLLCELVRSEAICDGDFPSLQRLLWTGEPLPHATLRDLMQRLPLTRLQHATQPANSKLTSQSVTNLDHGMTELRALPASSKLSSQSVIDAKSSEVETIPSVTPVLEAVSFG